MKKVIFLSLFITLIIPNIVLAAWWNPLSWFNGWTFTKNENNQTQILEKRIEELENKIDNNSENSTVTKENTQINNKPIIKSSPSVTESNVQKEQVKNEVPKNNTRLLTQADRDYFVSEAEKVVDFTEKSIESLDKRRAYIQKSKYRGEYLGVEQAILETKRIFESDKKAAETMILAVRNANENDYVKIHSAYNIFLDLVQETADESDFMFASIDNLMKQSNEIVELQIREEVINELSW